MSALLVAAVVAPAAAVLGQALSGRGASGAALGAGSLTAFIASIVIGAALIDGPAIDAGMLSADRLSVVLMLLISGVTSIVGLFAGRYLHGDVRRGRLLVGAGVLASATLAMATASTLLVLAAAWTVAGLALLSLLGTYRGLPAADDGVRRTRRAFLIADSSLWAAVLIAQITWGGIDLRTLSADAPALTSDTTATTAVAILLVVAAVGRSALLPLGDWLPATLAAPTPVSALLHAGVVNAGGVLLVTMSPVFGASAAATAIAFTAGAATAVHATAVMLTKSDIKGALAHSTAGQMGFMVMTCGLWLYAAAIFHLVAHGMYKAALFLGSGGALDRARRHEEAPARTAGAGAGSALAAVVVPGVLVALAAGVVYGSPDQAADSLPLLVFAWISGSWAMWGWLGHGSSFGRVIAATGVLAVVALGYVAGTHGMAELLAPALAGAGAATVPGLWIAAPLALMIAVSAIARGSSDGGIGARLYVLVLSAGHPRSKLRRPVLRTPAPLTPMPTTIPMGARS